MDNALKIDDFSFNEEVHIDQYLENEILVQKFDVNINQIKLTTSIKRKIVILCYNLFIDGEFIANSCDLIVFAKNIVATNNARINLSGLNAKHNADKKASREGKNGDNPNGANADNIDPTGKPYELNGFNGGNIELYVGNIEGELKLISNGGNGGKGQDGDEGINGRNGLSFPAFQGRPKVITIVNGCRLFIGEDGLPAGKNGNGANGGKGGNSGSIYITKPFNNVSFEQFAGKGGIEGIGAKKITKGGIGGIGYPRNAYNFIYHNQITNWVNKYGYTASEYSVKLYNDKDFYNSELNGKDLSSENGQLGIDGKKGSDGEKGILDNDNHHYSLVNHLPASYFRILILEAEFLYINNDFENAKNILEFILEINLYINTSKIEQFESSKLTAYLEDEPLANFKPLFDKTSIYYNQLNQNLDFFGNATNYVSLIDSEFIGEKISKLHPVLIEFKNYANSIFYKFDSVASLEKVNKLIADGNSKTIGELLIQNNNLSKRLTELNKEILVRQNEVSKFKNRILQKENAFKRAVESAKDGCDLKGTLLTITKLVSVAVTISSGIGAIGGAASVLSDSSKLLDDFTDIIGKKNPGFDLDSWSEVFNDGGENSILEKVKKIQSKGNDFKSSVGIISDFVGNGNSDKPNNELVAIQFNPDKTEGFNKEDFINQMKGFIVDFPEAKVYQDEVLSFIDYCDITNQKRIEFTSVFLNIIQNIAKIDSLNVINTKLNSQQFITDQTKIPYSLKILFLDSYINAKIFFLKLLYLQNKALSYFTLEKNVFSSKFYKKDIQAYANDGILNNEQLLINYLVNEGFSRNKDSTIIPLRVTSEKYPLSFDSFILGDDSKVHKLLFSLEPKANVLADYREVFIKSIKINIDGITTNSGKLKLNIKHLGNSYFIKADTNNSIYFSHKPVVRTLTFDIKENNQHSEFSSIIGDYLIGGKKPFVELSPFANWELTIDGNLFINDGLNLDNVKQIELDFEFFHKPTA